MGFKQRNVFQYLQSILVIHQKINTTLPTFPPILSWNPMVSVEDRLPHAAASSFALVIHLISRLLPMPLAVDDAQWPKACFWAGDQARMAIKLR